MYTIKYAWSNLESSYWLFDTHTASLQQCMCSRQDMIKTNTRHKNYKMDEPFHEYPSGYKLLFAYIWSTTTFHEVAIEWKNMQTCGIRMYLKIQHRVWDEMSIASQYYECTDCVFCNDQWILAQNRYAVHVVSRTGSGPSYAMIYMHLGLEWRAVSMINTQTYHYHEISVQGWHLWGRKLIQ